MTSELYLHFPLEGIALDEVDRLRTWMSTHRDQTLWHQMSTGVFVDTPNAPEHLLWIVQQHDCDRATAAAIFSLTMAYECVFAEMLPAKEVYWEIAQTICARAVAGEYTRSVFADPSPDVDVGLAEVQELLAQGIARRLEAGLEPRLPLPAALFEPAYPDHHFVPRYLIEQDSIVRIDSLDDRARVILGL